MDHADLCRAQADECHRLMLLSQSGAEATILTSLTRSWKMIANQTDRYVAIIKKDAAQKGHARLEGKDVLAGLFAAATRSADRPWECGNIYQHGAGKKPLAHPGNRFRRCAHPSPASFSRPASHTDCAWSITPPT